MWWIACTKDRLTKGNQTECYRRQLEGKAPTSLSKETLERKLKESEAAQERLQAALARMEAQPDANDPIRTTAPFWQTAHRI